MYPAECPVDGRSAAAHTLTFSPLFIGSTLQLHELDHEGLLLTLSKSLLYNATFSNEDGYKEQSVLYEVNYLVYRFGIFVEDALSTLAAYEAPQACENLDSITD